MFTSFAGKSARSLTLSFGLITAFAIGTAVLRAESISPSTVNPSLSVVSGSAPLALPQEPPTAEIKSELITISPYGIHPRAITRPAGAFMLVLENRSGLQHISLQIKTENGEVLKEIQMTREDSDWSGIITLPAGRYSITEASHEGWNCTFTATE